MMKAVPEHGSSSAATKIPKVEIEKKLDLKKSGMEAEGGESYICRVCYKTIGRQQDPLTTLEVNGEPLGVFQIAFNVIRDYRQAPDTGVGGFIGDVLCQRCELELGGLFIRVDPPQPNNMHIVPGNYLLQMNQLIIRRGDLLLHTVTREPV